MLKQIQSFLAIYTHPYDLSIGITTDNALYGFLITTGEGRSFAPIVKVEPAFPTIDDAVAMAIGFLTNVVESTTLVPEHGEELGPTLTLELINQIQTALNIHHIATTWDMKQ